MNTQHMTKRLQVLLDDEELADVRLAARKHHQSVAEWVRSALRQARATDADRSATEKLGIVRASTAHQFPSGAIEEMLDEIEQGYRGAP